MIKHRIAFLNGSLRKDSFHGRLGLAIAAAAGERLEIVPVEIGHLPLYNQDKDGDAAPPEYAPFRAEIAKADGMLFGSPEYNRGISGTLKNAVDVGSRPYGKSVFARKPAGIFSASPGMTGGFGSNHSLRQCCVFLDMPVMQQPEAYWGLISDEKIAPDGTVSDDMVGKLVHSFAHAFADWVDLIAAGRASLAPDPTQQG